jgi:hypothetical protein
VGCGVCQSVPTVHHETRAIAPRRCAEASPSFGFIRSPGYRATGDRLSSYWRIICTSST